VKFYVAFNEFHKQLPGTKPSEE